MTAKTETRPRPLLFETYPALEGAIPWLELAPLRTPVERLAGVGAELGVDSLWVKRDDQTSPLYGGNKCRKMEFILADARAKGRDTIITTGGIGSNHCLANAIFCKELGLHSVSALIDQPVTPLVRKNLLLDYHYDTEFLYAHGMGGIFLKILWKYLKKRHTYFMWPGGSTPLGTLGFVNAALELREQVARGEMPEPDHLFVACGSTGTAAGLALGLELAGLETEVHAVQVSFELFTNPKALRKLATKAWRLLRKHAPDQVPGQVRLDNVIFDSAHFGGEYGRPTAEGVAAIQQAWEADHLKIEPTYTGKAFAALIDFVQARPDDCADQTLLFWNTYNSRDFSDIVAHVDYHALPEKLHWVFEEPLPDFGLDPGHFAIYEH